MPKQPSQPKVALVTGAARRIGAQIARTLHEAKFNVALHYNGSHDEALSLCEELSHKRPHSACIIPAQLESMGNERALIKKAYAKWGRLDVLVNNASRFYRTGIDKATEYTWDDLINSNLRAPFFLIQAAIPHLRLTRGVVVNIGDIYGERPLRDYSIYCISKSGLLMMTKVLAKELGPDIRVNAVSPGAILWPEGENALSNEAKQHIIQQIVLKREGEPKDIAKAVLFLVQDAPYVTGQVLTVDGGRSI